ncbi:MAG: hypothetical protein CME70_06250 [Halobacteriovorax sp.]|nr:hypothetical protein [Halobacteriovorax sp.]|tara:strand:+ start:15013 stop:18171 length:3159 start_codon:yes stop_codon:yes gene_type:complete
MSLKCIHISDIHFRGLSRHDEYRRSFEKFFEIAKDLDPDVIYVGGDIVHSKTQGISPELIDILNWWFTSLADIAPTHVILGNHDGLILNKHRQDAISPILSALNNPNIHLYKNSGTYPIGIPGFNWSVFSCFDEENWPNVKPTPNEINIALFHGGVRGSKTDINWNIEGEVDVDFFKNYDFTMLGDIHKVQYLDDDKRVAYCGSSIQQNYGETPGKGFLFWEIEDKDNFTSTFYEIPHDQPFVTIDWSEDVQSTLDFAETYPDGSRFRIRTNSPISQPEIKQLHSALKEFKDATEVVYKNEYDSDVTIIKSNGTSFFKDDLRDSKTHCKLMREYYSDLDLTDDEWDKLEELTTTTVNQLAHNDAARNIKWSIRRLEFDNIFSYGKGNVIDFENLGGITGLFGPNRIGKSSIPGAIMYGLFNTTDRGSIKNLHIINSRKGFCKAGIDIAISGKNFRVERQSVKHETRAGKLHAVTHLNLHKIDDGLAIDMTEEQRRETEKVLRSLIGTSDDFLLTSLASQGEMNAFIKHKATQRKSILTNFLDLNIFENMLDLVKDESATVKALLKSVPNIEYETKILEAQIEHDAKAKDRDLVDAELTKLRKKLQGLKISLATHKDKDIVTPDDVTIQQKKIDAANNELLQARSRISALNDEITILNEKLVKIENIRNVFPIDDLKERLAAQLGLERSLIQLRHDHEREKTLLKTQKNSIKRLEEVPCGDSFPTCKFIKESHKNKKLLTGQLEKTGEILSQVKVAQKALDVLLLEDLSTKIQKYDDVLKQESELKVTVSSKTVELHGLQSREASLDSEIDKDTNILNDMKLRVSSANVSAEITKIKGEIVSLTDDITTTDAKRMSLSELIGRLSNEIIKLKTDRDKYTELLASWKTYELFMNAVSKKGIPLQIITSQLPAINAEISKILQDVVGFTVELEAESTSNAMDIYINYGDSRRIIECGSGMEKMMASLAIRVALINVSSLPKTDLLVIDEGFGALDDMNVESCNRLLKSLKRWFKNILVISHVDGVKDIVDNTIEISSNGKNAQVICNGLEKTDTE